MTLSPVVLRGATIELIPLGRDHLEAMCAHGLDPQLWHATTLHVGTRADMEAYISAALDAQRGGTALPFAIVELSSGKVIGSTRFHSFVPEHRRVEIGFTWIATPWQRTGVNAQAKYLMLRHAFESLDCIRVQFHADAQNEQSCRALLRLGAKQEGVLRNYRVTATRGVCDLALFSILASEWSEIRDRLERESRPHP